MNGWEKAKARSGEFLGRAEEAVGAAYGDAALEVHGESVRMQGEAEEDAVLETEREAEEAAAARKSAAAVEALRRGEAGSEA